MRAVDVIRKKRDGHVLTNDEIETFVTAATKRTWLRLSWVSGAADGDQQCCAGMDAAETLTLTRRPWSIPVRAASTCLILPGIKVDKAQHRGVSATKPLLYWAPLVAACGVGGVDECRAVASVTPAARSTSSKRFPVSVTA